ncbi:hypothetical protein [Sorangium cellulosum]|uniref:SNF2 N-terminal domain-containing protein n=1 Tax=Sorangium cellulosum So0157-2 TaxID=1254432 RepID=S4XPE0_SORCE|nr:hypothetical protein [Sorangium cellulosum]AGP33690.1 hypothetical protein SCE1572_03770 [Sorangium cellulosum So0157-2]
MRRRGSVSSPDLPIASPFFGAVQVEDFQLVPLLKALQMPRVSLLLADDVGLGKTVEAWLVLATPDRGRRIQQSARRPSGRGFLTNLQVR